ncbi:MAG: hypothetical protein EOO90_17495 [Pedobacter sp.]|nr:MAG: hypothetical protein EOO90_17495 [Pedobacter sp.]
MVRLQVRVPGVLVGALQEKILIVAKGKGINRGCGCNFLIGLVLKGAGNFFFEIVNLAIYGRESKN